MKNKAVYVNHIAIELVEIWPLCTFVERKAQVHIFHRARNGKLRVPVAVGAVNNRLSLTPFGIMFRSIFVPQACDYIHTGQLVRITGESGRFFLGIGKFGVVGGAITADKAVTCYVVVLTAELNETKIRLPSVCQFASIQVVIGLVENVHRIRRS
ncbi:hypothetical protein SDC9_129276 [bioreactor metagenome]|uniref:Uncharacterized protein n=1 Tax=bioreactor metagenome TaxID=1076179 RepID=A0A645CZB8_9ZZZZ